MEIFGCVCVFVFLMRAFIKTCTLLQCNQNVSLHLVSEDLYLYSCGHVFVFPISMSLSFALSFMGCLGLWQMVRRN